MFIAYKQHEIHKKPIKLFKKYGGKPILLTVIKLGLELFF